MKDKIFGCVLCNIEVPDSLKDYFSKMGPICKNIDICSEDIGDQIKAYAMQYNKAPQTKLDRLR